MSDAELVRWAITYLRRSMNDECRGIAKDLAPLAAKLESHVLVPREKLSEPVGVVWVHGQTEICHGRSFNWLYNPVTIPDGTRLYALPSKENNDD